MSTETTRAQNLVGRDVDLAKLVGVIEGTDEAARGAIVVCGARGIGRSSLVTAAVGRLDLEPVRMLGVPCQATSTYASLVHSLSGASGHLAFGPLVPRWLDIIAAAGTTASHIVARRMLASMPDRSTRPPLVLVIDDAHFFDHHSQEVVAYLAHHGAGFGLRSVLTVDDAAPLDAFASLERLRLRPLDVAEVRALLESATEQPLPHRVARQLHRWTGGNPALVLDLSRQLTAAELAGTRPIGLPLVPSDALVRRLGGRVQALDDHERCCLAVFAQCPSLGWQMLPRVAGCSGTLVDGLVSDGWLAVHHRTIEPRRRADALVAWAGLAPSLQHELNVRLAAELRETSPATADYFAAHSGDARRRTGW